MKKYTKLEHLQIELNNLRIMLEKEASKSQVKHYVNGIIEIVNEYKKEEDKAINNIKEHNNFYLEREGNINWDLQKEVDNQIINELCEFFEAKE